MLIPTVRSLSLSLSLSLSSHHSTLSYRTLLLYNTYLCFMVEWLWFVRAAGGRVRQQRGPAARDLPDPRQRRLALCAAPLSASLPRSDPRRRASTRANSGRTSQAERRGGALLERAVSESLLTRHAAFIDRQHSLSTYSSGSCFYNT